MNGIHRMKSALEASMYESKICALSMFETLVTSGTLRILSKMLDFRAGGSGGVVAFKDLLREWENTADDMASPNEPPIARRKLEDLESVVVWKFRSFCSRDAILLKKH